MNCGLVIGKNVKVLTDINVSLGALFDPQDKTARFDAVILPFSEYVTVQEYRAYQDFVAGGGTLLMTGRSLEYPVTYDPATNVETLVYAHGWALHGSYASPIPCNSTTYFACAWSKNTTDWAGSTPCCFHNYKFNGSAVNRNDAIGKALFNEFGGTVFKYYASHEESRVSNMTGTSVASVYVNDSKNLIAAYTHHFRKGSVVAQCIFADDIIATDPSAQYFLLLGLVSGRLGTSPPSTSSTLSTLSSTASTASTTSSSAPPGPTASSTTSSTLTPTYASLPPHVETSSTGLAFVGGLAAVVVIIAAVVIIRQRQARLGA